MGSSRNKLKQTLDIVLIYGIIKVRKEENTMERVFQVDINNRFMCTIKAKNTKQAEEMAKEMYPNVKSSIQVWEMGANGEESD
jgi:Tfp pilus assembly ATPase PilU